MGRALAPTTRSIGHYCSAVPGRRRVDRRGVGAATLAVMSSFEERRRARAGWPIRRSALAEEALTDDRIPDDVDERIAMVATLTRSQWAIAGMPLPQYRRADMPGQVIRRTP